MAEADIVAFALNRLADHAFTDALSSRDKASMVDLIADIFVEDLETEANNEDESGKTILIIIKITPVHFQYWMIIKIAFYIQQDMEHTAMNSLLVSQNI